jgi:hypothetical protein
VTAIYTLWVGFQNKASGTVNIDGATSIDVEGVNVAQSVTITQCGQSVAVTVSGAPAPAPAPGPGTSAAKGI